jgi:hypothetical protein
MSTEYRSIKDAWEDYKTRCIRSNVTAQHLDDLRNAFFIGATIPLAAFGFADQNVEKLGEVLETMADDVLEFKKSLKAEHQVTAEMNGALEGIKGKH